MWLVCKLSKVIPDLTHGNKREKHRMIVLLLIICFYSMGFLLMDSKNSIPCSPWCGTLFVPGSTDKDEEMWTDLPWTAFSKPTPGLPAASLWAKDYVPGILAHELYVGFVMDQKPWWAVWAPMPQSVHGSCKKIRFAFESVQMQEQEPREAEWVMSYFAHGKLRFGKCYLQKRGWATDHAVQLGCILAYNSYYPCRNGSFLKSCQMPGLTRS